jgi:hypothetical protein
MILDLKSQELMNRVNRFGIGAYNQYTASAVNRFESVFDVRFQACHIGGAGRRFGVSDHRQAKIAFAEKLGDVREMMSDLIAARAVVRIVCGYFNRSAIRLEPEVMSSLLVTEAHRLIAALVYIGVVLTLVAGILNHERESLFTGHNRHQRADRAQERCESIFSIHLLRFPSF